MLRNADKRDGTISIVKTGRFRKGDLVLLYTLKKLKRKLKMRGLGPFVINELSPSGAVRLETLDGEPMANYINGSRLKLYHEPLTQEMLDRMHAAKTRKAQAELLKQKAKEEADERARAAKAKRLKAKMLTLSFKSEDEEDQFVEPFRLEINLLAQKATVSTHALIDSGADLNVISWEIWDAMGQPKLDPSKLRFIGFSQAESECLGSITFKVSIQDEPLYVKFYVATKGESVEHVILGRLWMLNTNCQLDWETRRYKVKVNNRNLTGSCVENQQFQVFQHESDTNITKARGNNDETIIRLTSIQSCNHIEWLVPENFEGSRLWLWKNHLLGSKAHTQHVHSQGPSKES